MPHLPPPKLPRWQRAVIVVVLGALSWCMIAWGLLWLLVLGGQWVAAALMGPAS